MTKEQSENPRRVWQVPRLGLLDDPGVTDSLVGFFERPMAGTGEPRDPNMIAAELKTMIYGEIQDSHGIHIETVLAAIGALAGFAVQMGIREEPDEAVGVPAAKRFVEFGTKSGEKFYFGDLINGGLLGEGGHKVSVYGLIGGAAQASGAQNLADCREIAAYVVSTLGSDSFGLLRVPPHHAPQQTPIDLLNILWNPVRNYLAVSNLRPSLWCFTIAHAGYLAIIESKNVIDPALAFKLVMEAAIMMSKFNPERVYRARFEVAGP